MNDIEIPQVIKDTYYHATQHYARNGCISVGFTEVC